VPISSTFIVFFTSSAWLMRPTMSGWLMVWPPPIGSAVFSQARSLKKSGTKASRGTRSIAASTSRSVTPPWRSSMMRRARRVSDFMTAARRSSLPAYCMRRRPREAEKGFTTNTRRTRNNLARALGALFRLLRAFVSSR
jgi:hypothetical protein